MEKHFSNKRIIKIFLCIMCNIILTAECFGAEGRTSSISTVTTDSYNVMLLIDKSGSMNSTDSNRLALSAACQFVDQLCTSYSDLSSVTNVGLISFSRDAQLISAPIGLDSVTNTDYLKSEIRNIEYDPGNTGGTDLGTAIYEAAELLKKQSSVQQKNMIVVFTDGYSENVRNKTLSEERMEEALKTAGDLSCEIYIVGLNQNNYITEKGKDEIYSIADSAQIGEGIKQAAENDPYRTGEMVNYLITDNKKEVSEFYGHIYAKMRGSEIIYIDNHSFKVTSSDTLEVDVMVYSEEIIDDIALTDPDGNIQEEDGETFFISGDPYYRVIRILEPKTGTWNIHVETADESYMSYVVKLNSVEISVGATWGKADDFDYKELADIKETEGSKEESDLIGQVTAVLMYKGEQYQDNALIESVETALFEVADPNNNEILGTGKLTYDPETGKYMGYFPVHSGHKYIITATVKNDSMERTALYLLTVNSVEPVKPVEPDDGHYDSKDIVNTFNLETINIEVGKDQEIDISKAAGLSDAVIQEAIPQFEGGDSNQPFSINYDGSMIAISGERIGRGKIVISVLDKDGTMWTVSGNVNVQKAATRSYLSSIFLLALLIIILIMVKNKLMRIKGYFLISVEISDSSDSEYAGQELEREITGYPRGRMFSLWSLMKQIIRQCEAEEPREQEICKMLKREKNQIEKKKLVIYKDPKKRYQPAYRLKDGDGRMRSLKNPWVYTCCKDFSIRICFKNFMQDSDGQNSNFGKLASATHSKKGRSARAKS